MRKERSSRSRIPNPMEEKTAKRLELDARRSLLQAMLKLIEVNSKVKSDKMSAKDSRQFQHALKTVQKANKAAGQTIAATPPDDELYAQMAASHDRLREEIEHQIKIVEQIIARQSINS